MRICLISAAIAGLILFGLGSVGLGQQSQDRNGNSSTPAGGNSTGSTGSTFGTTGSTGGAGGGQGGQSMFGQPGQMSRLPDRQSGEFVGVGVEDVRRAMTATGARREGGTGEPGQTGRSGFSPLGSRGFARDLQSLGMGYRSGRATSEIRARVRLGFSAPRLGSSLLAPPGLKLAARLEKSSWLQTRSPVQVSIEDDKAILRGMVATEHDRRLAEQIARLEPGIRQVDNQLTVAPPVGSPMASPTME